MYYSTTATDYYDDDSSTGSFQVFPPYVGSICSTFILSEFEAFIALLVDYYIDAIGYIKRIFKLTKWYIVFMFNCFMIRAPCKK